MKYYCQRKGAEGINEMKGRNMKLAFEIHYNCLAINF